MSYARMFQLGDAQLRKFQEKVDFLISQININITSMMECFSQRNIVKAPELDYLEYDNKLVSPNTLTIAVKAQRERLITLTRTRKNEEVTPDELEHLFKALKHDEIQMFLNYPHVTKDPKLRITTANDVPPTEEQLAIINNDIARRNMR
jgi:hypothetical protein